MKIFLFIALLFAYIEAGTAEEVRFVEKHITKYPFVSTPERSEEITANYTKIKNGMTEIQVEALLGAPDEIRPLYEPKIKHGKLIGHTYWYILRRTRDSGSVKEKDESLVRVSFDSNGNVTHVDRW